VRMGANEHRAAMVLYVPSGRLGNENFHVIIVRSRRVTNAPLCADVRGEGPGL
jgi:hypothetical protein